MYVCKCWCPHLDAQQHRCFDVALRLLGFLEGLAHLWALLESGYEMDIAVNY